MIIKTITCHDVYNLGASLQAYALTAYLRSQGHDVQIIDYRPDYLRHYRLTGIPENSRFNRPGLGLLYQIAKFPGRLYSRWTDRRKKTFDTFTADYLPVTEKTYSSNNSLKQDPPAADLYIAGSDQIWNPVFKNGKDPAFYLDFVPENKKRISYAASFAVEQLPTADQVRMKSWLQKLDAISVRESSAVALLKEMDLQGIQVLDPVFLLPALDWHALSLRPSDQDYILVYDFDNNPKIREIALQLSRMTGKRIVSLFAVDWADKVWSEAGPREFLGAVENAAIILSNSFHATAFSLIFQKDFYVVNREEGINARMKDLVGDIELSERLIRTCPDEVESIQYERILPLLEKRISRSKHYLSEQLQN